MRTLLSFIFAVFLLSGTLSAQYSNSPFNSSSTAPSGTCTANTGRLVGPSGTIYTCQNGHWGQVSGGAGGALPAGCPGAGSVQLYATSATFGCDANFIVDTSEHVLIYPSFLTQNTIANTGDLPLGVWLWGNRTYGCAASPGADDPLFGDCPVIQVEHVFPDGYDADVIENNISYFTASSLSLNFGGAVQYNVGLTGSGNYIANPSYLPVSALKASITSHTSGTVDFMSSMNLYGGVTGGGTVANWAQLFFTTMSVNSDGSSLTNGFDIYMTNLDTASGKATNPYYSWMDSRGVRRVKEDNTFNSVGQAIEALYNPQFTKYTPGAVNYERIVLGEWDTNVAKIGTECGGTGTCRATAILSEGKTCTINTATGVWTCS